MLVYARYSSANQRDASIEDQLRRCTAHVRSLFGDVTEDMVFSDAAISGSSLTRPAFERAMLLVTNRKADVFVTEDVSRISRDFADSAAVLRQLEYEDVRLIGVADGIDTAMGGAKLLFGVKSAMNEAYLDDLRYNTRRGLEGRCRAGFSTGGLPLGYRSEAATLPDGREIGRRVVIDAEAAAVVRRVFDLYLDGYSYDAIAKRFNSENVPYARMGKKFRRQGWVASSVRAVLHNRAYIGEWVWNQREWRKRPGSNKRRSRPRMPEEVISQTFPDRRIIAPEVWDRARRRASAVAAKYKTKTGDVTAPGNHPHHPLSGLLACGLCGAAMVVSAGTSASYYICGDAKKRGTCSKRVMLREDVARSAILGAVRDLLFTPAAVTFLRAKIAERFEEWLARVASRWGAEHSILGEHMVRVAPALVQLGDAERATVLLRWGIDLIRRGCGDFHLDLPRATAALAASARTGPSS